MGCCHLEGWTKNFVGTPHWIRAIFRESHYNRYMLEHNTCLSQAVFYNSDVSVDRIIPTATEKRSAWTGPFCWPMATLYYEIVVTFSVVESLCWSAGITINTSIYGSFELVQFKDGIRGTQRFIILIAKIICVYNETNMIYRYGIWRWKYQILEARQTWLTTVYAYFDTLNCRSNYSYAEI